jgi:hypothetical protein
MTNKITLNDLKMAEHLLEENCVKIVEIFFRLNINGIMSGKSFSHINQSKINSLLIISSRTIHS